uniref:DNA polymerase gamma ) n=1 Tax=Ganoderma boninense TaxID=34458 RepID=A0A5K1K5R8_9APHY|nr:DNA polymerase gamma (EC (Mitochondrial DNA polymerase catalytic subunit) [Ganoderma boninense]
MRLSETPCKAIPADSSSTQAPRCPYRAGITSPFCREHAEELSALEERERAAAHDAALLRASVDDMLAEGVQVYLRVREVRKDERIVRLYAEALERQVGAAVALKSRFFSEGRGSEGTVVLEERKASIERFLAALQARADAIERELELKLEREREQKQEQEREAVASPSESPAPELSASAPSPVRVRVPSPVAAPELGREPEQQEQEQEGEVSTSPPENLAPELPATAPAPVPSPAPVPAPDAEAGEPPAYPILEVPHPPYACTADSSDTRPEPRGPPGRCTALRVRDGERCTWTCRSGRRFCMIHCVSHGAAVVPYKVTDGILEAERMRLARGEAEGGRASTSTGDPGDVKARRIEGVKDYVETLEVAIAIVEEHQRLFSCRSPESHAAVVQDLKQRWTSAGLLLGKLSGRTDAARIAEDQGQAETWATEFLAEVKHKDALESRKTVEDLVTGAIVGGATAWFGVPWARSALAGVVSSIVVRKARDAHEKS